MRDTLHRSDRVLVIDDNPSIHEDLRKALASDETEDELDELKALMFGTPEVAEGPPVADVALQVESAHQGEEGLKQVQEALFEQRPFALAFVDMRMPPGWDGLETIEQLWKADPDLHVVLCTAYSDHSWSEIHQRLGRTDQLMILKKPFDVAEARQMAHALVAKWNISRAAQERLIELEAANAQLAQEIEARREAENQMMHGALHDTLTDLPNRALLSDRIDRALNRSKRDENYYYSLLFLDLDDFKIVNDSLGHVVGDRLLVEIAARVQGCIRRTDCASRNTDNTAARLGGDEFVVLLEGLKQEGDAQFVAQRLLEQIAEPLVIEGHELRPSVSIGIVQGSRDYDAPSDVLRDADTALYRAKQVGKACFAVFDEDMRRQALARLRVESDLRQSIERDELFLQYQPIVELVDGAIVGFEALVRWQHPKHGVIPPLDFVPMAEETGLILPLGDWVLRHACAQVASWRQDAERPEFFVNVNISSKQLKTVDFVENVRNVLAEHGLDRTDLNLELTESILMQFFGHGAVVLEQLEEERLKLHVDDFGTGFSSLAYLNRLPISALKLDRSFIKNLGVSSASQATVRAVIQMAHARGLKMIAEGVETPEQLATLQELGCDFGQGFYFSRPVDAELVLPMLERPNLLRRAG
jgi:diguanylate cyclase (GGDEF)-like protein